MDIRQLKLLAGRVRGLLQQSQVHIGHNKSLELVATLAGLRNWPEVLAFPNQVAGCDLDLKSVERLSLQLKKAYGLEHAAPALLATLLRPNGATHPQPMFTVEIRQEAIPSVFRRFCDVIGERAWLDHATHISTEIKRNPFLREYLPAQNSLVLALTQCSSASAANANRLPLELTGDPLMFEAHMFAFQTLGLIDAARQLSDKRADMLISRIRDALRYPTAIQALQLEARVATHFVRLGQTVRFPELGSGNERFDLLVESLGPNGLEIECKAVTHDKGRKIHRSEVFEFYRLAFPMIQTVARDLASGLAVVVTVPGRMPSPDGLEALVQAVGHQLFLGQSGPLQDGTQVRLIDFQPKELGELTRPPSAKSKAAVARITGTDNRECIIYQAEGKAGVVVMILQSAQADSMLHEVFATLAESAARQLTGKRAGAFIGGFQGLGREALLDIALGEGQGGVYSPLAWAASRFLERPEFPHVVGVGFLSAPESMELPDERAPKGAAYYFPKPTSSFWHGDFSGMFGHVPRPSAVLSSEP